MTLTSDYDVVTVDIDTPLYIMHRSPSPKLPTIPGSVIYNVVTKNGEEYSSMFLMKVIISYWISVTGDRILPEGIESFDLTNIKV